MTTPYRARALFATAGSDLLTDVNAYEQCMRLRAQGEPAFNNFCEQVSSNVADECISAQTCFKNFISTSTVQSIRSLRNDFFSYLTDLGFVPHHLQPSSEVLNSNCDNTNLVKSVILGGLWPHAARVRIRTGAQKFDQVQAGTIAREIKARDYLLYDIKDGRVFLHPGSILFDTTSWKSDFVTYFNKYATDKVYLRDATQVSIKACITGTHANESIGATVRIVAVGRPRSGQSRCGRPERDQQRQHYQIEGVAAHWYTSQSTSVRPYFVSSH